MPLQIVRNDITKMKVDAVVNTTNPLMIGFNGVDYAIHSAAGSGLEEECQKLAPIPEGCAVVTGGYNLHAKYIIHTCGPIWKGGNNGEEEQLESCYVSCLSKTVELKCKTVAFPLISSGVYGYPKDKVLSLAVRIITDFLIGRKEDDLTVYICVFDRDSYDISQKLFGKIQDYIDDNYTGKKHNHKIDSLIMCDEDFSCSDVKCCGLTSAIEPNLTAVKRESVIPKITFVQKEKKIKPKKEFVLDLGFADMLFKLIDEKGLTDVQCYQKANVSRKTFSKIRSMKNYKPSKETAVAFAIALELSIEETEELLKTAGFALSHSNYFDVIIEFFIKEKNYDVYEINEVLFKYDQVLLG